MDQVLVEPAIIESPPPPAGHISVFRNVVKRYLLGKVWVEALRGIDHVVPEHQTSFIVGPSGSGKTTFLNLLGLIDRPTEGQILILGHDMTAPSDAEAADFRSAHIGFIFQSFNLISVLSLRENVELALLRRSLSVSARRRRVEDHLGAVGLGDLMDRRPGEVSGGQRQRAAIARALAPEPELIIADEPTANLDSRTSADIMALFGQMQTELGATFVICTHEPSMILPGCRVTRIVDGNIAEEDQDR